MTEARPTTITFKRREFYGDFARKTPKWHLLKGEDPGKWSTYVAMCGYTRSNILGDLDISKAKAPKKADETCGPCIKALGKEQARLRKEAANANHG